MHVWLGQGGGESRGTINLLALFLIGTAFFVIIFSLGVVIERNERIPGGCLDSNPRPKTNNNEFYSYCIDGNRKKLEVTFYVNLKDSYGPDKFDHYIEFEGEVPVHLGNDCHDIYPPAHNIFRACYELEANKTYIAKVILANKQRSETRELAKYMFGLEHYGSSQYNECVVGVQPNVCWQ